MPFHPSNAYHHRDASTPTSADILHEVERGRAQASSAARAPASPCATRSKDGQLLRRSGRDRRLLPAARIENLCDAADILDGARVGSGEFWLSVYPSSQPVNLELTRNGVIARLMTAGATIRTAFCGPCFGAGDVPANGALSIRHTTRNFPNREGSKPGDGQIAAVALMDARSIAATAAKGGVLTAGDGPGRAL